ncbi:MAG TPA: hypothetical protein VFF14_03795 [Candidatus Deferrimicrobium sp.]|nr:hypothetical protein [Candidatus Deferrimicrobium sp.]
MRYKLGNLMKNGSFELGLLAWQSENVVTTKGNSHTGVNRAMLGGANQLPASLSQDIRIAHKRSYLLSLFACASGTPGDLHIKLVWLNKRGAELGVGLNFDISGNSFTPHPNWSYYIDITGRSPDEARLARLIISKDAGGIIILDDIMFYDQGLD